jgi:hypothetical protein
MPVEHTSSTEKKINKISDEFLTAVQQTEQKFSSADTARSWINSSGQSSHNDKSMIARMKLRQWWAGENSNVHRLSYDSIPYAWHDEPSKIGAQFSHSHIYVSGRPLAIGDYT